MKDFIILFRDWSQNLDKIGEKFQMLQSALFLS